MVDEDTWWDTWMDGWDEVTEGLRDRIPHERLEEIRFQGAQEPSMGLASLLGGHELGKFDLTSEEEDALWTLTASAGLGDEDVVVHGIRGQSVRNRPVRSLLRPAYLTGGGHGPGTAAPGKTEFPATWSRDDCVRHTMDVARRPSVVRKLPTGDFRASGQREGLDISVVVTPQGQVRTSYPVRGPGVVTNPLDDGRAPAVARLQRLLDELVPATHTEPRTSLDELLAVGEWPHVVASLLALPGPRTEEQQRELAELARAAGLPDA